MKKKTLFAIVPGILLTIPLTGCPIWWEEYGHSEGQPCLGPDAGDDSCTGYYCYSDFDCPPGSVCLEGACIVTSTCTSGPDCPEGYVCDAARSTCVPADPCLEDADCMDYPSYCDEASGICIPTGYCWDDEDCKEFGESFVCSDLGVCEPDEGPCPDGHCGCLEDLNCTGGWVCVDRICRDPEMLCVYNFQCPEGSVCLNSLCRADCSSGAGCPTGQVCAADLWCEDDPVGGGQCVYASQCGENQSCVNGYCTARCTVDGDCTGGLVCRDHACRMPCAADVNCSGMGEFTRCAEDNVCRTPEEIAGMCARGEDCASGNCLNGACI